MFLKTLNNLKTLVLKWKEVCFKFWKKKNQRTRGLLVLTITAFVILSLITIFFNKNHKIQSEEYTQLPTSVPTRLMTVNRLDDIAVFNPPTPPLNHDSIITTMHDGVPLTKYIATEDAVPKNWSVYNSDMLTFRYPSDYFILPIDKQRILFFTSKEDLDKSKDCIDKYDLVFQDNCPIPTLILYYAATKKGYLEKETSYFKGDFHKVAAFYAIDNREWLVSRLFEDNPNTNIVAQTATQQNIVEVQVLSYNPDTFSPKENATHGENFATEVFKILSTISILNDNLITNYSIKNPNIKSSYEIEVKDLSKTGDNALKLTTFASGLDYLPEPDRQISLYYPIDKDPYPAEGDVFTFLFAYPQGLIRGGTYSFDGINFSVKNKNDLLVPYLENDKYCQTDSDCSFSKHYCGVGFYNKYRMYYLVWGCEGPTYDENGIMLDEIDPEKQCILDLKYDGVSCTNNQCIGINQRYVCKEDPGR